MSFEIQYEQLQQAFCTWDQEKRPLECRIPHPLLWLYLPST